MTNERTNQQPIEPGDERARRIAEARARAEAARQARLTGEAAPSGQIPASEPPVPAAAPSAPEAAPTRAATSAGDERAQRIAEARARAEAARAGRPGGDALAEPTAEAPPPVVPQRRPEEEAARRQRLEEARTGAAGAAPAQPAAAAPAARPAAPAAATAPVRPMPTGPDEWRAPAGAGTRVITARPDPGAVAARELDRHEVANLVTRRSMMRTTFWGSLAVTIAGLLLGFVNFFWPRKVTGFGGIIRVPASLVPKPGDDPVKVAEMKGYVVNLEPGEGVPPQFAGFALPSETGGILALWWKCPHLGCTVPWRPEFEFEGVRSWFRCPCHGSTYTKAGVRVFGPAPRPLDTFAVTVNSDGSLAVDTGKITPGGSDNPQRAIALS